MITPQRKSFPAVQTSRKISGTGILSNAIDSKGKAVAFAGEITPLQIDSIGDKSFVRTPVNVGYADDWRRFKEAGLLDEASMEMKERQALLEKVSKLDKELFDYQHNMGLLLIEKRKWTSENEELSQALAEVEEILKREQTANLIALSEAEKRKENLRKALIDEKQSVAELKFALQHRLQEEHCHAKATYETKLAEANSLIVGIEQKATEMEKLRHVAEEKLAEVNRKETEVEKKIMEVENRESLLHRERLLLATERETHEATVYKLREELSGREKKLTVEEHKLSELDRYLNERKEKVVDNEGRFKQKESSLELTLEEKKKLLNEEFRRKQEELEQQKAEINHMKEEMSKKEAFLNKKSERVMEKELELEARWKIVKEKEESFIAEETSLQMEKQKLDAERVSLCELKDAIEGIGAETTQRESRVYEEHEKLKMTKEDGSRFVRLQFELKQQMEKCGQQEELILKEHEGLRQERNKFEKEWSLLEEKRAEFSKEQKVSSEQKEKPETLLPSQEKGLKGEVTHPRDYPRKELDDIKLHEEALEATTVSENRKQEENEKDLGTRVANFELRSMKQLGNIGLSKKLAQIEMENVHSERRSLERQTKEEQTKMDKDIDEQTVHVSDLALLEKLPSSALIYDAVAEAGDRFETSAADDSHMEVRKVETSNASQYSGRNTYKPRRGKSRKSKTQSSWTKNATEEASIEGNPRKRQHGQTSKRAESEQDGDEDDRHAHSLTAGGRRKRRQITGQVPPSPVQHSYNLRRRKK